jgi:hypothetical protein
VGSQGRLLARAWGSTDDSSGSLELTWVSGLAA